MNVISLQSGSNGNCIYVETRGIRLLFDAGISGRQAQRRLAARDRDIGEVDGVLISHDHRDHSRCMGIYQRKFGLPVYVTRKTLDTTRAKSDQGNMNDVRFFQAGSPLSFGDVVVETIRTPHDGSDGVAFVVDDGRRRLGILTDLGHVFDGLASVIGSLDAIVMESNYDPQMLTDGSYPYYLKERIRGPRGHLSNDESARIVRDAANHRLEWVCLAHLSEENNRPEIAMRTHRETLGNSVCLYLASRYRATDVMDV